MSCLECQFAIFQDEGYSNYTVENTAFLCVKKLHPDGSFDRFYGKDEKLNFGDKCVGKVVGEPIEMDVEQENIADLTESQKSVWAMYQLFDNLI